MNLLKKIKKLISPKVKQARIATTDILPYDTSLVHMRNYKELTQKEKAQVDEYMKKTKIDKIEDVAFYGEGISKYSTGITELLLSILFKITDGNLISKLETKSKEELLTEKLNNLIAKAQMQYYKNALFDLKREVELRTIALQEIFKRENKVFRRIFGAPNLEKTQKQFENRMFEDAIERMKICARVIEEQLQATMKQKSNMRSYSTKYRYL